MSKSIVIAQFALLVVGCVQSTDTSVPVTKDNMSESIKTDTNKKTEVKEGSVVENKSEIASGIPKKNVPSEFDVFGMKLGVDRIQPYINQDTHDPEYSTVELDGLKTYQVKGKDIEPFTSVPKKGYVTALVGPKTNKVIGYVMYRVYSQLDSGDSFSTTMRSEFLKIDRGLEMKYKLLSSERNPGDTVLGRGTNTVGLSKRYNIDDVIIEITIVNNKDFGVLQVEYHNKELLDQERRSSGQIRSGF